MEVAELDAAKAWFSDALGVEPYFDEPFYVGFDLAGSELGLMPADDESTLGPGGIAYWAVDDIQAVHARLLAVGATEIEAINDVGGGVLVSRVASPQGCLLGLIQEPAPAEDAPAPAEDAPAPAEDAPEPSQEGGTP